MHGLCFECLYGVHRAIVSMTPIGPEEEERKLNLNLEMRTHIIGPPTILIELTCGNPAKRPIFGVRLRRDLASFWGQTIRVSAENAVFGGSQNQSSRKIGDLWGNQNRSSATLCTYRMTFKILI
jgi:hypothetical protein